MSFADQLKKAREKAGLSIADAAKSRGVSPRTWAYWEAGLRLPPAQRDAITREHLLSSLTKERPVRRTFPGRNAGANKI